MSFFQKRIVGFAICILFPLVSQGCISSGQRWKNASVGEALSERYFHVSIPSFDGLDIRATVFQPALKPGETAPVIFHAHGFGVWRMHGPYGLYGWFMYTGKAALAAWRKGYWVISYDQRGFGGSEGKVHIQSPDYEVQDVSALIDWAEANLPRLTMEQGDPVVGMIGESYGGGIQLMASAMDERIDAIIPVTTWHSLETSLQSNDVPKSAWLNVLVGAGNFGSRGDMGVDINKAYLKSLAGEVDERFVAQVKSHGMNAFCAEGRLPMADALIIQGFRDTLFPINEGFQNLACMQAGGRDVRLIGVQDGHLLPVIQRWSGFPLYHLEDFIQCGNRKIDMIDMAVSWFDDKLKHVSGAADHIPGICLTLDYSTGIVVDNIMTGGDAFDIPSTDVRLILAGAFELLMQPLDRVADMFRSDASDVRIENRQPFGGTLRPAFVPLKVMAGDDLICGIPEGNFRVERKSGSRDAVVFAGIGVRRPHKRYVELISEQVVALKGPGEHTVVFPGVSRGFSRGDVLGVLLYGFNSQYMFNGTWLPGKAVVAGRVKLPLAKRPS